MLEGSSADLLHVRPGNLRLRIPSRIGIAAFCIAAFASGLHAQRAVVGHGTTIVILRSPDLLVAAVDSKETDKEYRADGSVQSSERIVCKAAKVGGYYAIASGVLRGDNGFDALKAVSRIDSPGEGIDTLTARVAGTVAEGLRPLLSRVRDTTESIFRTGYQNLPATQIALLGVDNRGPQVRIIQFIALDSPAGVSVEPRVAPCPGNCRTFGYALGTNDKITEALRADPRLFSHTSETQAERLIDLEYADRPDVVGGPVTVFRASRTGISQIRNGACAPEGEEGAL